MQFALIADNLEGSKMGKRTHAYNIVKHLLDPTNHPMCSIMESSTLIRPVYYYRKNGENLTADFRKTVLYILDFCGISFITGNDYEGQPLNGEFIHITGSL